MVERWASTAFCVQASILASLDNLIQKAVFMPKPEITKEQAIAMCGGKATDLADALCITRQAVANWPAFKPIPGLRAYRLLELFGNDVVVTTESTVRRTERKTTCKPLNPQTQHQTSIEARRRLWTL